MRDRKRIARSLALTAALASVSFGSPGEDPSVDPYTRGEPEWMAAAGIVSYGPFEFSTADTEDVSNQLSFVDLVWMESEHFELGFGLGPYKVKQKEKKKIRAELTRLAEKLPSVDPKAKVLDPWLRAHLFIQRMEDAYDEFLALARVDDSAFPDGKTPYVLGQAKPYMGEGPYLGQKGKFEVLLLPSEAAHVAFLRHYHGLTIKRTQRWNVIERDTLSVTIHTDQGRLRDDPALHGHVVFNLAHVFLDAYKHYSYDTPLWLHEGLAHYMERRVNPFDNTFDGGEGAIPQMTRKSDWTGEVRKLVSAGKAPRLAEMVRFTNYGEFELEHHYTTWSMVTFLVEQHPDSFARLLATLKGRLTPEGLPDGANLVDVQRDFFRDELGMSFAQFDAAWAAWVLGS